ncbi:hypothetical protein PIB30_095060 [Stylosanthes scabra]|uniref:Uncharacterized protein n=1 Tax=Stylosanthes scabra TaxID=79078 RepID=A0ABU6RW17_9FABA|nr:hypothetical protein [Stylosanthes scabra]
MSPSGMISFSHAAARAFPSPARAGTSSQPELGPDHPAHSLQILRSTQAEFASLASTYHMTRASHDLADASSSHALPPPSPPSADVQHGAWVSTYSSPLAVGFSVFDPSRIGSEYATPPSYQAPSSYHSQSFHGHSAPFPSATQSQQSPVDPAQSAEAP